MSNDVTLSSVTRSEWIKFRTIRSTIAGVLVMFILTIGLGALIAWAQRANWNHVSPERKLTFDPTSDSLFGIVFSQFAVGVIGVILITSEYASGAIRTTLAAVPQRMTLVAGKLIVMLTSLLITTEIACFVAFLACQSIFSGVVPTASLSASASLRAVIFGGLYLTILSAIAFALGLIFRHTAAAISVFVSLVLVLGLLTLALPQSWQNAITKFEPSQIGNAVTSVIPPGNAFSPIVSILVLLSYAVVLLVVGAIMLQRRDA